ncbi:MAG: hypothetical protein IT495_22435 [Gammaproteobacteria bacterium]|nr:hypothetical protein [Gammaproteobacteria bacterium]
MLQVGALGASLLASSTTAQELVAVQSTTAVAFRGEPGRVATFVCPSTFTLNPQVWGTDVYHFDSEICPAAVHAGVLAAGTAGQVTFRMAAGTGDPLLGTTRNGVTSRSYPRADATYSFIGNGEPGQVSWYTTYARVPDDFGSPITVLCPPNGDVTTSIIIGTDVYRDDSAVCVAAVHAGIITVAAGGRATLTLQSKRAVLAGSTRNGVTSQPWRAWDYLSFPQPYAVTPGAVMLTVPTSAPATSTAPRQARNRRANSRAAATTGAAPARGTGAVVTGDRPAGTQPTVMSNAPAPTGLTVTGTPTTATVQWLPVAGATGYLVNRAIRGTTQWTAVTPARIAETTSPTDQFNDRLQTYTYQVLAYQADGSFGAATVDYVPAKPRDPSGLAVTAVNNRSAVIGWQSVENVWEYLVSGPGISPSAQTSNLSFVVVPPGGGGVYRVASIYRPGGVLTPDAEWPSVAVSLTAGAPGFARPGTTGGAAPAPTGSNSGQCACTRTGSFSSPALRTVDEDGLTGSFTHPTAGSFTIDARSVAASVTLTVTDAQNRVVLSESRPAGWALSPDNRYFAVVNPPQSRDTAAPIRVFRVAAGPSQWSPIINTTVDADGRWAFSAGSKIFLITRLQNSTVRFSFQAYNLEAPNPNAAMVQDSEADVRGATITTSPCDDRLMYFRWTQTRGPLEGSADFYDRVSFGPRAEKISTSWDHASQSTPTASIVAEEGSTPFMVALNGLEIRGGGGTTFPSLQCAP